MKKTVKIIIAHDNKILGQALMELLSAQPDFLVNDWVSDFSDARRLAVDNKIDIIVSAAYLVDESKTGSKPGNLLVIPLRDGSLPIEPDKNLTLSIEAGLKDLYCIIRRAGNDIYKNTAGCKIAYPLNDFSCLTSREREIFSLMASGLSNHQIGQQLFITERTVKYHVSNILRKLNASSRTEAAIKYMRAVG